MIERAKVFIKVNSNNCVTDIDSDKFIEDVTGWIQIDEGTTDRHIFPRGNYLSKQLFVQPNVCRYKYVNGVMSERSDEEIQSDNIEKIRKDKKEEVSITCQNTIFTGYDVETSKGTKHFSLTIEDQTNLNGAYNAVLQGEEAYPYHADGELCQMYSAEDIKAMSAAAVAFKLYHVTYCNHLNVWINRSEVADEIKAIYYGVELPEDLKANFELIIGAETTENETVS